MALDFESAAFADDESVLFDALLFFSSFSVALSTSIGSSLSSFPLVVLDASEFSLDFFDVVSVDALSVVPFAFEDKSFADAKTNCYS